MGRFSSSRRRVSGRKLCSRRSYVPKVLSLEDRTLPSVFTVMNLADTGTGSLRQAVLDANHSGGPDQIVFASGLQGTIALTSGELSVTDANLTIAGPGAGQIAVSGSGLSRVFDVSGGPVVTIAGLTITDGVSLDHGGGGIFNEAGATLNLNSVVVRNNLAMGDAQPDGTGGGGGLWNQEGATANISDSVFTGNVIVALNTLNAAGEGGGIDNDGTMTVFSSTFTANVGFGADDGHGGAIANDGTLTVISSMFTSNQGMGGSGGTNQGFGAGGAIAIFFQSHGYC